MGAKNSISEASFLDRMMVGVASFDKTISIFNQFTAERKHHLKFDSVPLSLIKGDGSSFCSSFSDHTVKYYDYNSSKLLSTIQIDKNMSHIWKILKGKKF